MRIGFDAGPVLAPRAGVGWYTYQVVQALLALDAELDLIGYVKPGRLGDVPPADELPRRHLAWAEFPRWWMRGWGRRDRLDLYHGTNFKMQTTGRFGGVVTIYDLWLDRHPEYSKKLFGQRSSSRRTRRTVAAARKVLTISEFSAAELTELYGVPRERIEIVYCGVSDEFHPVHDDVAMAGLRRDIGLDSAGYFLFVGGADPRKNHRVLLEALARHRELLKGRKLVLVGNAVDRFGSFHDTANTFGLTDSMIVCGHLTLPQLRLLYSRADAFVFPSLYEGFGMPVLEAMACGAPVVTSSAASMSEVAGEAALLVDPQDPEALAQALARILGDASLRDRLRTKGFERITHFTWRDAAKRTLAIYRELCRE